MWVLGYLLSFCLLLATSYERRLLLPLSVPEGTQRLSFPWKILLRLILELSTKSKGGWCTHPRWQEITILKRQNPWLSLGHRNTGSCGLDLK